MQINRKIKQSINKLFCFLNLNLFSQKSLQVYLKGNFLVLLFNLKKKKRFFSSLNLFFSIVGRLKKSVIHTYPINFAMILFLKSLLFFPIVTLPIWKL